MSYYCIKDSLNRKIIGKYPQTKSINYNCDVWDEPKFIQHIELIKIDFEPITANAILDIKSKQTDLINANSAMGFSRKLLVSGKLKAIIQKYKKSNFEFYKSPIIHNKKVIDDYFILVPFNTSIKYLNFRDSEFFLRENLFDNLEKLTIANINEYEKEKKIIDKKGYPYHIYLDKIIFEENINEHFLILNNVEGGIKYIVSEKLKKEIEEAGCTGIEFQPVELSINEWLQGGEREKIYGKL